MSGPTPDHGDFRPVHTQLAADTQLAAEIPASMLGGRLHEEHSQDDDANLDDGQERMHHIKDCVTCGVDWCAKVTQGECVSFAFKDEKYVLGAELDVGHCSELLSATPYCATDTTDHYAVYAATRNKVQSKQPKKPTTSEPAAGEGEDETCPKPSQWCSQPNTVGMSTPVVCSGTKGHFCRTETEAGFSPCDHSMPATWGYGVLCENESLCACSSTCSRDAALRSASGHCGQAIEEDGCTHERLFAPSQPKVGLVVLERNEVYRVDDMVYCSSTSVGCFRARLDARTIMCEEMYRHTLLRKMFKQLHGDTASLDTVEYEHKMAAIAEPFAGYAYASYKDAEAALGQEDALGQDTQARLRALSELVEAAKGDCTPAAEDQLVVPLRMGDIFPTSVEELLQPIKDALATPTMQDVRSVVFNAVMHYGANEVNGRFMRDATTDAANLKFVDSLSAASEGLMNADLVRIPISFRSEPSVDKDLCYLVHSPNVLIAAKKDEGERKKGGGFPLLIAELRDSVRARKSMPQQQQSMAQSMPNVIFEYGAPRTATTLQFTTVCAASLLTQSDNPGRVSCTFSKTVGPFEHAVQELMREVQAAESEKRLDTRMAADLRNAFRNDKGSDAPIKLLPRMKHLSTPTGDTLAQLLLNVTSLDQAGRGRGDVQHEIDNLMESAGTHPDQILLVKTHSKPGPNGDWTVPHDSWLFTTLEHAEGENPIDAQSKVYGHQVMYVQRLDDMEKRGLSTITADYQPIFGLSAGQTEALQEYLAAWDTIRECCGAQMAENENRRLRGKEPDPEHSMPKCPAPDRMDALEKALMQTQVYKLSTTGTAYLRGASSSESDAGFEFTGSYCSWFSRQVKCQDLDFNRLPTKPYCKS